MGYRNGTYVAFNGCGTTNPTESDMKYYGLLQQWNQNNQYELNFSDSHKKTCQVLDSSQLKTLKDRLLERMKNSKNMLLIITENSSWNRGLLNFEIEKAIVLYKIPIIVAYTGYTYIMKPAELDHLWPEAFKERIKSVKAIHIPFKQIVIADALSQFNIHSCKLTDGLNYYSKDAYKKWGIL